jgi:hypothetical protein
MHECRCQNSNVSNNPSFRLAGQGKQESGGAGTHWKRFDNWRAGRTIAPSYEINFDFVVELIIQKLNEGF